MAVAAGARVCVKIAMYATPQVSDITYSVSTPLATLSGHSEAGSVVTILDKGAQVGTATADSSGAWSFTAKLGNGVQSCAEQATDPARAEAAA